MSAADTPSPPPPESRRGSGRDTRLVRVAGALAAGVAIAPLTVAAWLDPSPAGHGTHTDLGLVACGFVTMFDKPCPSCGMTTAFAHAADCGLVTAFLTQPMGMLLAVTCGMVFWVGLHTAVTGSAMLEMAGRLVTPRVIAAAVALAGLAWLYKLWVW